MNKKMNCTERKRLRSPFQPVGRWIRVDKRLAIYLRDRFTCLYCLRDLHGADPCEITLDHAKPKADGGSNGEANVFTACRCCNSKRQDTPLARYAGKAVRQHIARNMRRSLLPYRTLAKAVLNGDLDHASALKQI